MKLLLDWLERRRGRWPNTVNVHLLFDNQTAGWGGRAFRGVYGGGAGASLARARATSRLPKKDRPLPRNSGEYLMRGAPRVNP